MQNVSSSNSQAVNVPKLRFPGFTEEWQKEKLRDFTARVTRKNKETACLCSAILAAVGIKAFESVEKAAELICFDKVYESKDVDYSECYERFLAYDKLLNI